MTENSFLSQTKIWTSSCFTKTSKKFSEKLSPTLLEYLQLSFIEISDPKIKRKVDSIQRLEAGLVRGWIFVVYRQRNKTYIKLKNDELKLAENEDLIKSSLYISSCFDILWHTFFSLCWIEQLLIFEASFVKNGCSISRDRFLTKLCAKVKNDEMD